MDNSILTPKELRRMNRHIQLPGVGIEGQEKLKRKSVLVVGAGGLGGTVLLSLATTGVGLLGIIDHAVVDEESLLKQSLYGDKDLGKLKSVVARNRLMTYNPMSAYEAFNLKINPDNVLEKTAPYDLVVDATNSPEMSFLINDACLINNKPFVTATLSRFISVFGLFNAGGGPSYRCHCAGMEEWRKMYGDRMPSLSFTYSLAGNLIGFQVFAFLAELPGNKNGRLISLDIMNLEIKEIPVQRIEENFKITGLASAYS